MDADIADKILVDFTPTAACDRAHDVCSKSCDRFLWPCVNGTRGGVRAPNGSAEKYASLDTTTLSVVPLFVTATERERFDLNRIRAPKTVFGDTSKTEKTVTYSGCAPDCTALPKRTSLWHAAKLGGL